jgi:hypothetical protein
VPLTNFLSDSRRALAGHFFTASDLDAAAAYLSERGLIEGTAHVSQLRGPAWARIKANGIDCIEQGGNVADYLTPPAGGVTYNFNAPLTGTNIAVGNNATQHASVSGIDSESLHTLMTAILQAMPSLGLDATNRKEAENAASQIIYEIGQPEPNRSRLRKTLTKIREALTPAARQALTVVLNALIDYECKRLGLPPGE